MYKTRATMYNLRNRIVYNAPPPLHSDDMHLCLKLVAEHTETPFIKSKLACVAKGISPGGKKIKVIEDICDLLKDRLDQRLPFRVDGNEYIYAFFVYGNPHGMDKVRFNIASYSALCYTRNFKKILLQYTTDPDHYRYLMSVEYPLMLH